MTPVLGGIAQVAVAPLAVCELPSGTLMTLRPDPLAVHTMLLKLFTQVPVSGDYLTHLLPTMVAIGTGAGLCFPALMGLAMSPGMDALMPGWVDLFGGRQSARTIHFIVAWLLVAFVLIHVFEVIITGVWNNLRSMITGNYRVDAEDRP